ncbi:EamA-like transporter family protein [uncultured archaeon]|nr:EamA-like transporter family protein [uncultured archaeon]
MQWLVFAFLGTIFFSAAGVIDKLLLGSYAEDSRSYIICQIIAQQVFTIPIILFVGADFAYPESILALLFGCLQVVPTFFYMRALQMDEASKVTALEFVYLVFVFMGSVLLLGEMMDLKQCAGGILLVVGSILISCRKSNCESMHSGGPAPKWFSLNGIASFAALSPAIKPFLPYWILTAAYYLTLKYLLISIDEWHLYTWSSLGNLVAVLPLLIIPSTRRDVFGFFSRKGIAVGVLISEEVFQFLGIISSIFAYSLGSVSLVSSIGALQPIMTVLIILALGLIVPGIAKDLNEKTDWIAMMQKGLAFMVMIVGIYLVG